jgi:hypothetical protein
VLSFFVTVVANPPAEASAFKSVVCIILSIVVPALEI